MPSRGQQWPSVSSRWTGFRRAINVCLSEWRRVWQRCWSKQGGGSGSCSFGYIEVRAQPFLKGDEQLLIAEITSALLDELARYVCSHFEKQ